MEPVTVNGRDSGFNKLTLKKYEHLKAGSILESELKERILNTLHINTRRSEIREIVDQEY